MPKKAFDSLSESMFYILMAFQQAELYGTEIVDFIAERTKGRVHLGPGTLYTILAKFEEEDIIKETAVYGRKRTYCITEKGRELYQEELERLTLCLADAKKEESL